MKSDSMPTLFPDLQNQPFPTRSKQSQNLVDSTTSKESRIFGAANEVASLLVMKNADYGDDNIKKYGEFGVLVRLTDKFARLQHLWERKAKNESIDDTIDDIIGYALILKLLRRGQW